jgi:hypothetical protein
MAQLPRLSVRDRPRPTRCQEPLCSLRVLPFERWCFPPPREALPPHHRSYGLMRQTKTLPLLSVALCSRSLQVVASPCWEMAFPDVISASPSLGAWTLTPVGPYGAYARFFPQNIGLPRITSGSAPTLNPYSDFSTGLFTRLQSFRYVQAPRFAHHPGRSYRSPQELGSRDFYFRAPHGSLPPRVPDILAVRIGQLTTGDLHPIRLAALSAAPVM